MYRKFAKSLFLAYDNFSNRRVHECRRYLERTQWLKKRDLQRLQVKRLKALLIHADEHVPYYHEAFRKTGFRPECLKSMEDLSRIPVLKRQTVRDNLKRMMTDNVSKKQLVLQFTSGTTSAPLGLYRSKEDLSWGVGAEFRAYGWAGYEVGDTQGLLWMVTPEEERSVGFKLKNLLLRNRILNLHRFSEKTMESFAEEICRLKLSFLRGYAASTNIFASFLLHNTRFQVRPQAVFTSASTLLPNYRRTIEEAFGCKVYDYYATCEMSHIAAQCGEHEGLHVSDENVVLETVRDGEQASFGEEGTVLLTNLHNYGMPLIRYDIGDMGVLFDEACPCGRGLSLVKPIGRTYETFVNSDGSFTTLRHLQTLFEDLPVSDFQVVQESLDGIVVKVVREPGYSEAHTDFIVKHIKFRGKASIRVELVDSIPLTEGGKMKHIVSKIASKYT